MKTGFMRGPHGRLDSCEDMMGRLDSCEDHMEDWIHQWTTWNMKHGRLES